MYKCTHQMYTAVLSQFCPESNKRMTAIYTNNCVNAVWLWKGALAEWSGDSVGFVFEPLILSQKSSRDSLLTMKARERS